MGPDLNIKVAEIASIFSMLFIKFQFTKTAKTLNIMVAHPINIIICAKEEYFLDV